MDIGEPLEAPGQGRAHLLLSPAARTPGLASPGHLQHAVIGDQAHDAIEIVRVEGVTKPLEILTDVRHRRSEERTVGDASVSACRYRGWPYLSKQKRNNTK